MDLKFPTQTRGRLFHLGGLLGNYLAHKLHIPVFGFWRNLLSATVGAIIIITIYQAIAGRRY